MTEGKEPGIAVDQGKMKSYFCLKGPKTSSLMVSSPQAGEDYYNSMKKKKKERCDSVK